MKPLIIVILILSVFKATRSWGKGKLDIAVGSFSLHATTSRGSSAVNGIGSYQIAYRTPLQNKFELLLGFSLIASKVYTGDLGFGPDIGALYYPFTTAYPIQAETENMTFRAIEYYRPYIGTAFHQRQYQTTQSTYAGFSAIAGTEYYLKEKTSLKAEWRIIKLAGPSQATATEIDLLFGMTLFFD